ncbi:hypothetical protein [Enterobacter bugandensis]|uniref:hypothetical protein n=1 Tax=Enterobacter bugandensis TaxID=881260 RepID=UPI000667F497|nr:hypothetical protein [Enterobacter bugandensis]
MSENIPLSVPAVTTEGGTPLERALSLANNKLPHILQGGDTIPLLGKGGILQIRDGAVTWTQTAEEDFLFLSVIWDAVPACLDTDSAPIGDITIPKKRGYLVPLKKGSDLTAVVSLGWVNTGTYTGQDIATWTDTLVPSAYDVILVGHINSRYISDVAPDHCTLASYPNFTVWERDPGGLTWKLVEQVKWSATEKQFCFSPRDQLLSRVNDMLLRINKGNPNVPLLDSKIFGTSEETVSGGTVTWTQTSEPADPTYSLMAVIWDALPAALGKADDGEKWECLSLTEDAGHKKAAVLQLSNSSMIEDRTQKGMSFSFTGKDIATYANVIPESVRTILIGQINCHYHHDEKFWPLATYPHFTVWERDGAGWKLTDRVTWSTTEECFV